MPEKFIEVEHPQTGGSARVSERHFERQLKAKGWQRAGEESTGDEPVEDVPAGGPDEEESVRSWADADDETEEV